MSDWKSVVAAIAPEVGGFLGGPLGASLAAGLSQELLGKTGASDSELDAAVVGASPETLVKIKQIAVDFKTTLITAGVKLEELDNADRASARDREVKTGDWTPRILAALVVGSWVAAEYLVFTHVVDPQMRDFAMRLLGTLDGALMLVLAYYFGTSAGSAQKNDLISKALDK